MYLRQLSLRELGRIERLANDVKSLRVGLSTYLDAKAIAERYGTAKYENHWGTRDCAKGYYERCAYQISLKAPSMGTILRRFPLARRIGLGAWSGTAFITIENGRVEEYYFSVLFETPDRQWRGFGTEEYKSLEERAVAAHVSDSYVVSRNDIMMSESPNGQGFSLDSTLTPQATESNGNTRGIIISLVSREPAAATRFVTPCLTLGEISMSIVDNLTFRSLAIGMHSAPRA
jgi:hypothetical protein